MQTSTLLTPTPVSTQATEELSENSVKPDLVGRAAPDRVHSIDVFRGLAMLSMVFVNDLDMGGIESVPTWMKHATEPNSMTFVDVVAPAFLFVVGMAIPLAIQRRYARGESQGRIMLHALVRTASLLLIGVCMGNMRGGRSHMNPIGMDKELWSFLLLLSFIMIWNAYPKSQGVRRAFFVAFRLSGAALLVYLAATYREGSGDNVHWMRCRWYVIGAIGWAYAVALTGHILFRKQVAGLMGLLALLILLYAGDQAGVFERFEFLNGFRRHVPIGKTIGTRPAITVAGLIVGMLFMEQSPARTPGKRISWILLFAVGLFVAGFLCRPIYGLTKRAVTPTFSLYCSALCCVLYAFFYWLMDVRMIRWWSSFALPAGRNPLLPYFLSFMFYPLLAVLHLSWLSGCLNTGLIGIARSLTFAVVLAVFMTALLSRLPIRLRL